MLVAPHNLNETPEHYELKQIAKVLLWDKGYRHIATEVGGFFNNEITLPRKCFHKNTIDVVGADTYGWNNGTPSKIRLMGFEAKASLSDFRNGYCTACEFTYIIAPKGIVPIAELVEGVGLVEVDLANYQIGRHNGIWYEGVKTAVEAKSRLAGRFNSKEERQAWAIAQFRRIAYRSSSENVWSNSRIEIKEGPKKTWLDKRFEELLQQAEGGIGVS